MDEMQLEHVKRTVRVDVERAESGGPAVENHDVSAPPGRPSIVLYLAEGEPPRALLTDERGRVLPKVLSYVDLLYTLDDSARIKELEREPEERRGLPPLPEGAMLVDLIERASGSSYVVTGVLPPETHTFPVDRGEASEIFEVPMPHIVYRVEWHEVARRVGAFSFAILSPEHDGPVTLTTEVYSYPFSNVYSLHGGVLEGVCWPVRSRIEAGLNQVPDRIVRAFLGSPNDALHYNRDVQALVIEQGLDSYEELLESAESAGGVPHDWLNPAAMNVEQFHNQQRRES